MATLSETAYYSRRIIKYGSIVIIILIILRILFALFTAWWKRTHPPPPPPATVTFGQLPKLPFPQQEKPAINFRLETVSGTTGEFNEQENVYLMPVKRASLLALERATELAKTLKFLSEPEKLSDNLYEWETDDPLPSTLQVDLVTDYFVYDADWRVQPDILVNTRAPSEAEAITIARNWLSGLRRLPQDMKAGEAEVSYLKVSGTQMVPALSQSDAQFVRVNLFRESLEEKRILPSDLEQAYVNVTFIASRDRNPQVVQAEYKYIAVEYEQFSTYPLISSQTAWARFQEGDGFHVVIPEGLSEIAIRRIILGYYDPPIAGFFLQPIFVFEGDAGFIGYLPAVSEEWIQE